MTNVPNQSCERTGSSAAEFCCCSLICLVLCQLALDAAARIALGALHSPTFPVGATITDGFVQQSSESPRSTSIPIQRCPAQRPTQL
jgi:hypothetical protein